MLACRLVAKENQAPGAPAGGDAAAPAEPKRRVSRRLLLFVILPLVLLLAGGAGYYFFFFKKKNVNSIEATEPVVPNAPTPTPAQAAPQIPVVSPVLPQTIVTPAAAENPITSVAQGASQAATLGVAAAVVSTVVNTENTQ